MVFLKIAESVIEEKVKKSIELRLCPDQYVGKIKDFNNDFPVRKSAHERPKDTRCLIMILESPHIKEFKGEPGPAQGNTGGLIRKHILEVEGLSAYSDYGLILINAIQNQCSLGYPTAFYRDQVFIHAWEKGAREDFVNRLYNIYQDGDLILNCCTKGSGKVKKQELRRLVQVSIPIKMKPVFRRTHPVSWFSSRNRGSEWTG